MKLTDLIIIYLACGSPFGVYQITKRQPAGSTRWAVIVSSFLFWPIFAVTLLVDLFVSQDARVKALAHSQIEHIRSEVESIAFSDATIVSVFEFREVFYRFAGLLEAAREQEGPKTNELFEISGHGDKSLASRCLARRNRERLAFHQMQVRNEFVDLISEIAGIEHERDEIIGLALQLVDQLGDEEAKADLTALLPGQTQPKPAQKEQVWTSPTHTASTVN